MTVSGIVMISLMIIGILLIILSFTLDFDSILILAMFSIGTVLSMASFHYLLLVPCLISEQKIGEARELDSYFDMVVINTDSTIPRSVLIQNKSNLEIELAEDAKVPRVTYVTKKFLFDKHREDIIEVQKITVQPSFLEPPYRSFSMEELD